MESVRTISDRRRSPKLLVAAVFVPLVIVLILSESTGWPGPAHLPQAVQERVSQIVVMVLLGLPLLIGVYHMASYDRRKRRREAGEA